MALLVLSERVQKEFVSFDTNANGFLISAGTRELYSQIFKKSYIQDGTTIIKLWSDILRSFPPSFVVIFLARIPLVSLMLLSVHPVIYSVWQPASETEKSSKERQRSDLWHLLSYVCLCNPAGFISIKDGNSMYRCCCEFRWLKRMVREAALCCVCRSHTRRGFFWGFK